ncbi:hypothetical protein ACA910_008374 [Epithemia clementina (nom. ined.)]
MPWADCQHHFSGIPPHVTALHDLIVVRDEQRLLVDQFIDNMGTLLDERGIEQGGGLTVQNLQEVLGNGLNNIHLLLDQIEAGRQPQQQKQQEVVEGGGENMNQRVVLSGIPYTTIMV